MTDDEFELMDETYFVQHFDYLKETLGWEDEKLLANLRLLYDKGFIKCLREPDDEIFDKADIINRGTEYFYLATKKD